MAELSERSLCAGPRGTSIHPTQSRGFSPKENIFLRGEVQSEVELLVNHRDAFETGVVRIFRFVGHPAQLHRTRVGPVGAAQHFHQRTFTRAVFADQRMDFTGRDLQRHPF